MFDYFIGYKLGPTATPRDYLRRFDKHNPSTRDPRDSDHGTGPVVYEGTGCS